MSDDCPTPEKCTELAAVQVETRAFRELLEARIEAIEKSICVANEEMQRRLTGMNELREDLRRLENTFTTRAEWQIGHERVMEDVRSLRESRAELAGKASQLSVTVATLLAAIGLAISAFAIILGALGK